MDMSEPLKPAVLHILLALADGERHGYAIMQAARDQSRGAVPIRTGSFYRHLSQLIDAGWVAEAAGPRDDDPRRGAYYRLTPRRGSSSRGPAASATQPASMSWDRWR